MTRFAIALLAACALALTQAPGALALIQLNKGISGVRIGNTKAQVRASHLVALARPLDLDDAGAEVAEQTRAVGPG